MVSSRAKKVEVIESAGVEVVEVSAPPVEVVGVPKKVYPTDEEMRTQGYDNLSKRIRHLSVLGATTAEITKVVKRENGEHPRYQHVRNVLLTPLKKVVATPE